MKIQGRQTVTILERTTISSGTFHDDKEITMNFADQEDSKYKKSLGLGIVLLLHVVLFYALVTGLAKKVVDVIQKPIETKIITEEIKPPPEAPKPPPPPSKSLPPPTLPFVPPPEVAPPAQTPPDTMATTQTPDPNPAPTSSAAPAPDSNAQAAPQPAFADLNACKPEYPKSALMNEETGVVRVRFVVGADNHLLSASVLKSSGYKDLDKAAVAALSRCEFKAAMQDGSPIQSAFTSDYVWKLD
jgi:protein TonB